MRVSTQDESVEPTSISALPAISMSCRSGENVIDGVPVRSHSLRWLPFWYWFVAGLNQRGLADMRKFIEGPPSDQVRPPLNEASKLSLMNSIAKSAVCDSAFSLL